LKNFVDDIYNVLNVAIIPEGELMNGFILLNEHSYSPLRALPSKGTSLTLRT